jgi:peptidyl-dipeptidase Dcp
VRTLFATASFAALAIAMPLNAATAPAKKKAAPSAAVTKSPLLKAWSGPYGGLPPFDTVKAAQIPAAFSDAMAELRAEVDRIKRNPAKPTFQNTNEAMQLTGQSMERLFSIYGVMTSNTTTPEIQGIERELDPKISAFYDTINFDPMMFARYKAVYDGRKTAKLTPQQMRIVERDYEQLVRSGAQLGAADKAKLSDINSKLAVAFSDFGSKLLADENGFVTIDKEADLAGLPASFISSAKAAAESRKLPGKWIIKNTRSAVDPFLTFSTNRPLREKVWRSFVGRGDNGDANDTKAVIANILKLRAERAALLGFPTHAHYRMADTMAKTPERAMDLMMRVWSPAVARVKEEVADMQAIADKDGSGAKIEAWDYRYYAEKVRQARYALDQNEVKPYFEAGNMVNAAFYAAGRLYDLGFKEVTGTVPVFDPKVRVFEVTDKRNGRNVGLFYLDNFARDNKRSGAWMTTYRSQQGLGGARNVLASNNNNFVEGAKGEPTLISLDDAQTLFHEFGHAIHYFLQDVYYPALAGTPRDFVEYPSQVNEHWVLTRDVLDKYARHYKTGEAMPQALLDKIIKASAFNQGFATVEYLSSAILDMKLHNRAKPISDISAFEKETLAELGMPKEMVMRHRLPQFGHLFSSDGYSAGYYSYLWSETMDADTWAAFEEVNDPWHKPTADRFRKLLLSTGNETDRAEAYRAFRGRDPDVKALLKLRNFPTE